MDQNIVPSLSGEEFTRLVNNFYNQSGLAYSHERISIDSNLFNYVASNMAQLKTKSRVALVFICLNPLYWQFASEMVAGVKKFFLPGHDVDFLFWTDIPEKDEDIAQKLKEAFKEVGVNTDDPVLVQNNIQIGQIVLNIQKIIDDTIALRKIPGVTIIPTDPIPWPFPTLMRYHLFLQQEEKLKDYDYLYYIDVDMRIVSIIGDEILGEDLTAAQHPMYALRKEYFPPYEPNKDSACYIPRPGKVLMDNGKPRFIPLYYAGGFQGGKAPKFIEAMKEMREMIDSDLMKNYIPIWNDESAWNKYLFLHEPGIVLTPSYIFPDSLIKEYYEPLWGIGYSPKIVTITKWFSLSPDGGKHIEQMLKETKPLQ